MSNFGGQEQWLRWAVQPWTDEQGGIGGLIIASEDVSDERRALRDLNEAVQRFAAEEGVKVEFNADKWVLRKPTA